MALGVTFLKNEDLVAFGGKNKMLVLLVRELGIYKKELGNYAGYWQGGSVSKELSLLTFIDTYYQRLYW